MRDKVPSSYDGVRAAQLNRYATQKEYLANWLVPLEPHCERLVAYLERRTPWDS